MISGHPQMTPPTKLSILLHRLEHRGSHVIFPMSENGLVQSVGPTLPESSAGFGGHLQLFRNKGKAS